MEFNSAICTTEEQSKTLLDLGLKAEAADMSYKIHYFDLDGILLEAVHTLELDPPINNDKFIPAWSLHRLIEMLPQEIIIVETIYELSIDNHLCIEYISEKFLNPIKYFWKGNIFDRIICCIEWLIQEGYFNKEYLEE